MEIKIKKYIKNPITIEAVQYNGNNAMEIKNWAKGKIEPSPVLESTNDNPTGEYLQIETPQGTMIAIVGDYIIKGLVGEFYPCKAHIFELTYTSVEEE